MEYLTLDRVPAPILAVCAGLGALLIGSKIVGFVRLLLSLFVLPGKNVCL